MEAEHNYTDDLDDGLDYIFANISSQNYLESSSTKQEQKVTIDEPIKSAEKECLVKQKQNISDTSKETCFEIVSKRRSTLTCQNISAAKIPKSMAQIYQEGASFTAIERFNAWSKKFNTVAEMTPLFGAGITHYVVDHAADRGVIKNSHYYIAIGKSMWVLHSAWIRTLQSGNKMIPEDDYELVKYDHSFQTPKIAREIKLKVLSGLTIVKIREISLSNFKFLELDLYEIMKANGATTKLLTVDHLRKELQGSDISEEEKAKNGKTVYIIASNLGSNMNICQQCFYKFGWLTVDPFYFIRLIENYSSDHSRVKESECFLPTTMIRAKNKNLLWEETQ